MHINEFAKLLEEMDNQHIVITHTTQRTPMHQIRDTLKKAISADNYQKTTLLMDRKNL